MIMPDMPKIITKLSDGIFEIMAIIQNQKIRERTRGKFPDKRFEKYIKATTKIELMATTSGILSVEETAKISPCIKPIKIMLRPWSQAAQQLRLQALGQAFQQI